MNLHYFCKFVSKNLWIKTKQLNSICSKHIISLQCYDERLQCSPLAIKIIDKEFQKIVIRRYLERSIQKKFFSNLHSLQIKIIFQEKSSLLSRYMWFISMVVTSRPRNASINHSFKNHNQKFTTKTLTVLPSYRQMPKVQS